jgi:hypothetical protein
MARPSSSRKTGRERSSFAKSAAQLRKNRIRVDSSEELTPELFSEKDFSERGPAVPLEKSSHRNVPRTESRRSAAETGTRRSSHATVPKSLVKFVVGLFLAPLAWVLTKTFFQAFTTSLHHGLLATQSFGCFAAGMLLFGILFIVVPRELLMLPYVFGHELTHALWVKLFGGKVADQFHVSLNGGHVLTDRVNTWIALAPYFFPIYSLLVVTLYGAASLAADISAYRWLLFLLLGMTLAFHLIFTCLLIVKGQPDLHYGGTFFSLMVIYLINLLIITGLLLATSRQVTLQSFGADFMENSIGFSEWIRRVTEWIAAWLGNFRAGFGSR